MVSDPVKVCPHCRQPARAEDLSCLKCGHEFRLDRVQAKVAAGLAPPEVLADPFKDHRRLRVPTPSRRDLLIAGALAGLGMVVALLLLKMSAPPTPRYFVRKPPTEYNTPTYPGPQGQPPSIDQPPRPRSQSPDSDGRSRIISMDDVAGHFKYGEIVSALMERVGPPHETETDGINGVQALTYKCSDGDVVFTVDHNTVVACRKYPLGL